MRELLPIKILGLPQWQMYSLCKYNTIYRVIFTLFTCKQFHLLLNSPDKVVNKLR